MRQLDISTKRNPNRFTLVSDEDFDFLSQWKWRIYGNGYVGSTLSGTGFAFMHRVINNTPEGFDTDHINRDRLDNRRENLRTVNKMLNGRNRGENKNNTSGYKGVSWDKYTKKWAVYIWLKWKKIHLGHFDDIEEAYKMRKKGEELYWI